MKLAMYLRLSKDDGTSDESNSIKNQRNIIKEYIFAHPDLRRYECIEFKDDGISGKREDRPDFNRMLELIRKQQIHCVIVKDMSRFSRDQLIAGKYREQIFPFLGVRFISVNDRYDSINYVGAYGEIDIAFKEILNDMYSEDLSEKVKSALDIKRGNGKYICEKPPYGYRKSEDNRHQLVIDEDAAEVIRHIFMEYLAGKSMYALSKELNKDGIPCPAKHMQEIGIYNSNKKDYSNSVWTVVAVSRILHNEVYIGNLIYGKSKAKDTGLPQKINISKAEWKRVEGTHEAIVDRKLFKKVKDILSTNECFVCNKKEIKTSISSGDGDLVTEKNSEPALKRLVYCRGCGKKMHYDKKGNPKFCCYTRYTDKPHTNCVVSITNGVLEKLIIAEIQRYIKSSVDISRLQKINRTYIRNQRVSLKKNMDKQTSLINKIKIELRDSFEAFASGRITKTEYIEFKNKTDVILADAEKKLERYELKMQEQEAQEEMSYRGLHISKDMMNIETLSCELAEQLIDKVVVSQEKEVEIIWKFTPGLSIVS